VAEHFLVKGSLEGTVKLSSNILIWTNDAAEFPNLSHDRASGKFLKGQT